MTSLKRLQQHHFKNFFAGLFIVILCYMLVVIVTQLKLFSTDRSAKYEKLKLRNLHTLPKELIKKDYPMARPRNVKCSYWDCFDLYRCGNTGHDRITVYIYPLKNYVDEDGNEATALMTREYYSILEAVINSKYYTANPNEACLFMVSMDTLNQERINSNLTAKVLRSLPHWSRGENHIFFNMIAGSPPVFSSVLDLNIDRAMIAGADFNTYTFRVGFDIAIPVFSPILKAAKVKDLHRKRPWLLSSTQIHIDPVYMQGMEDLRAKHSDVLIVDACHDHNYTKRCDITTRQAYSYPEVLQDSQFCTVFRGERYGQFVLLEALAAGCIPVVVIDSPVMPFGNVIDWKRAAVFVLEDHMEIAGDVVKKLSTKKRDAMRRHGRFLFERYFSSLAKIVEATFDIVQDRVFPHWGRTYDDWNLSPDERMTNPLFLPITAPRSQGFTAVILTYDRVESLFILIEKISKVPSLMKVVVVWNNQRKSPPPVSNFPQISKPIKIIRTKANKLSNRFIPYDEIETEAILSIDDDIVMLTSDELEFGYEVWREFPDRIVGFPSRTHIWNNVTQSWKYESEWTNEISMVLTGAAFYHKYWNYLYTTTMPAEVRDWVDEHMNCEDIAMNFLVANITNKPPIKVAPRKKFKCPECTNNEMLSADLGHMIERSQCVDIFAKAFGRMPLQTVEFRADPVLYKDPFPEKLKRFNNIGSL